MSLTKQCRDLFTARDRRRGWRYFEQQRVEIDLFEPDRVCAWVYGSQALPYSVKLTWQDDEEEPALAISCNCPRAEGGDPCKHLWATLLSVDAEDARASDSNSNEGDQVAWQDRLAEWRRALDSGTATSTSGARQVWYKLSCELTSEQEVSLELWQRRARRRGWDQLERLNLYRCPGEAFAAEDREILELLRSSGRLPSLGRPSWLLGEMAEVVLPGMLAGLLLPRIARRERLVLKIDPQRLLPLEWDEGPAWRRVVRVEPADGDWSLFGRLERPSGEPGGDPETPPEDAIQMLGELVVFPSSLARLERWDGPWDELANDPLVVPGDDAGQMVEELLSLPGPFPVILPGELRPDEVEAAPRAVVTAHRLGSQGYSVELLFAYGDQTIAPGDPRPAIYEASENRLLLRQPEVEAAARQDLADLVVQRGRAFRPDGRLQLPSSVFLSIAEKLLEAGWEVFVDERSWRQPDEISLRVRGGVDWFELEGDASFGDASLALPELLDALERGARSVRLADGSEGILPPEWRDRFVTLAGLEAEAVDGALRYRTSQALLLDALLEEMPQVDVDRSFTRLRARLREGAAPAPRREPRGFRGSLRSYQRQGLGWLRFLEMVGIGGCLADDMGLGKTVQVLAMLQERRANRRRKGPSLIVAPRSVVLNWAAEADRFVPRLRVEVSIGPGRHALRERLDELDLVITTYGTLLRDIIDLRDVHFDYVILDEAQAIKNASSQTAKACRLLSASHRLALTGTPVENHLGELGSLVEFLNPGMLGGLGKGGLVKKGAHSDSFQQAERLGRALGPFILRRTKDEVLNDLPPKTEQVLYCELSKRQARLYTELRDHYRTSLGKRIARFGLARSRIQVLEALLRLRQAACHPALISAEHTNVGSVKLEILFEHLDELRKKGHKALIFSQFTSLLALVRERLDSGPVNNRVSHAYLDGRTRKRQTVVDRFQTDPDCELFLISLKAGGTGLNLTAADYVFLLDPWWNPAVEAQAVDRAHRIGQTKPVIAYRLIARGTVEEKILELQAAKRELAAAILAGRGRPLGKLTEDDLALLLG